MRLILVIVGSLILGLSVALLLLTYAWFNPSPPLPPNVKVWRAGDQNLTWSDFQSPQSAAYSLKYKTYVEANVAVRISSAFTFWVMPTDWNFSRWEAIPIVRTIAYVDRANSFAEPGLKIYQTLHSQLVLEHEQGHFNLQEAQRRRLQRVLRDLRGYGETPAGAVEDLELKFINIQSQFLGTDGQFDREQGAYDDDIYNNYWNHIVKQAWLKRIQDELNNRSSPLDPTKIQIEEQVIRGQPLAASARAHVTFVDGKGQKIEGEANPDGSFIIQIPPEFDLRYPIQGYQEIWFEGSLVAQPSPAMLLKSPPSESNSW